MRIILLCIGILLILLPVCAEEQNFTDPVPAPDMEPALDLIMDNIADHLTQIRDENKKSAESLALTGISGEEAISVIDCKLDNITNSHSSLIISPDSIVTAAAPSRYSSLIGIDLGYQPETRYANEQKSPVMSSIFYLEEGFYGISISYPVFSEGNDYLGYTDVTIVPEEFLRPIIVPFTEQTGYEVYIIQPDGLTIYETSEVEIGTNILTDPLYDSPEMKNLSHAVVTNIDGTAQYSFWDKDWNNQVQKETIWKTLVFDHQEWRIGIVRNSDEEDHLAEENTESTGTDINESISEMSSFVKDAAIFARSVGQEKACESFNNLSGPYVSGDRYIFAYDMNGTTLALPYQTGLLGKSRANLVDVNGLSIMPEMIDAAERGGELMYCVYPNPRDGYQNQLKVYRIEPVDSGWFIGSGIYLPRVPVEINHEGRDNLTTRVKNASRYAEQVGEEQAVKDFNDQNMSFANGGDYIFAYAYDGTTLAMPFQPESVGTNRLNFTDQYGAPIAVQEISAAERGGGYVYVVYYNPDTGRNELKFCYVMPAGIDWLVGSGVYTGTELV